MEGELRQYLCARCRKQVTICTHCDRGQIYCKGSCAKEARAESLRAAGRRYQASQRGKQQHAARQARYRKRLLDKKVTHQGSHQTTPSVVMNTGTRKQPIFRFSKPFHCHFCGRCCSPFVRLDFLNGRRQYFVDSRNLRLPTSTTQRE